MNMDNVSIDMHPRDLVAIVAAVLIAGGRGASAAEPAAQIKGVVELARSVVREAKSQVREAQGKDNSDV
jgi:hypothetical protein